MRRREFITFLAGVPAWPFLARAESIGTLKRIGLLSPAASRNPLDQVFEESLRDLGWVKDRDILIETRYTGGQQDKIAPMVGELVALRLDLLVTWTPPLTRALMQAAPKTPLVFVGVLDAIEEGVVKNLARPGGYATGISGYPTSQLIAKRLQLLKEVVPSLSRVALLRSTEQNYTDKARDALTRSARELNIELDEIEVELPSALEGSIRAAKDRGAQALYTWAGGFTYSFAKQICDFANAYRLPSIHAYREFVLAGGLLAYGPNLKAMAQRAAAFVDKILRGTVPGDIPVEQPSKFELVINLKTAKVLGLTLPNTVLVAADEVIE
jgi:putative ABC transport system substrate-binding protein